MAVRVIVCVRQFRRRHPRCHEGRHDDHAATSCLSGGRASSITITGQLRQAADTFPGNDSLAKPTVTLVPAGTGTIPCSVVSANGNLTATCQNVPVGAYTVRWQITGDYYTAPAVNTVLAVFDPSQPFVLGKGRVPRNGGWADFAISLKYGSAVPSGGIVYVEPSSTGDVVVASTSIRTVGRVDATRVMFNGTATINGAGAYDLLADITATEIAICSVSRCLAQM